MKEDLLELEIFLDRSKIRKEVLEKLDEKEQVAIFLAKKMKKHRSAISRALGELNKKGLVICTNPDESNYKKYKISETGKKLLLEINK